MSDEPTSCRTEEIGYHYREACLEAFTFRHQLLTILYSARLARKLTRAQLADRMDLPERRITDIELGREYPTGDEIIQWMIATGTIIRPLAYLMDSDDYADRNQDLDNFMLPELRNAYLNGDPDEN